MISIAGPFSSTLIYDSLDTNMEWDDVVYLSLLFASVAVGYVTRQIEDKESRKWLSSGLGFLLVFIVSGRHILHPIICTLVNAVIIIAADRR